MHQASEKSPVDAVPALTYIHRLENRDPSDIDLVVIHCTELPDLQTAREYGERICHAGSGTGNSGHYYIDRTGEIEEWAPLDRVAHHTRGYNARSIGIELVNRGRWPDWLHSDHQVMTEPYPEPQLDRLIALLAWLHDQLPDLRWVAGHEDLDREKVPASNNASLEVYRKRDPGPEFPWSRILAASPLQKFGE